MFTSVSVDYYLVAKLKCLSFNQAKLTVLIVKMEAEFEKEEEEWEWETHPTNIKSKFTKNLILK